jgi:hypothetical protein
MESASGGVWEMVNNIQKVQSLGEKRSNAMYIYGITIRGNNRSSR